MKIKQSKLKIFFQIFFLLGLIACMLVLCVESLMPGEKSAEASNQVSDAVDNIMTEISKDTIKDIPPESVKIITGTDEELILKVGGPPIQLGIQVIPSKTSVNYLNAVWSSSDPSVASVGNDGKVIALSAGETDIRVALSGSESIFDIIKVKVNEVPLKSFYLSGGDLSLFLGDIASIKVTFNPTDATNKKLIYNSSDPGIVSVNQTTGEVKAVSLGTTTITVTYEANSALTDSIIVTTKENTSVQIPVNSVQLFPSIESAYLFVGSELNVTAKITPSDATNTNLIWSSSDSSVLQVSGGKIKALKKGTATVTAKAASGKSDSLTLEVRNKSLGATLTLKSDNENITLQKLEEYGIYSLSLVAGLEGVIVTADSVLDETYIQYESSDTSVAEIYENGLLATLKSSQDSENGTVVLTVKIADNKAFSSENGNLCETFTIRLAVEKQAFSSNVSGWALFIRKLFGHFGAFLVMGIFAAGTFILFTKKNWKSRMLGFIFVLIFGFTFACLTELFQMEFFTTGRAASFDDVVLDCRGYFSAVFIIYGGFLLSCVIFDLIRIFKRKNGVE